jgi:hypothetical protein
LMAMKNKVLSLMMNSISTVKFIYQFDLFDIEII